MLNLSYYRQSGNASNSGIFIPRDNIAGLTNDNELNTSEPDVVKDCKFLSGFLTSLESGITNQASIPNSLSTALGFNVSKSNLSGGRSGTFNQTFTVTIAESIDYSTRTFYPISIPISGINTGRGVLKLIDIFPDALTVINGGAIPKSGVLIPHNELNSYGAESSITPDSDARKWFAAMIRYLFDKIPVRINTDIEPFSALITKTLGNFNQFSLPANALATTNPTTGFDPSKLIDVYSRTIQFNIEYLLNEKNQAFDVKNYLTPPVVRPSVIEFLNVPTSSINPIDFIDIRFSETIDLSTLNYQDISLTRDGGSNLVTEAVTVGLASETTYKIQGLTALTSIPGSYQITIDTNGIKNLEGNFGNSTASSNFAIIPIITLVENLPPTTLTGSGRDVNNNQWLSSSFITGSNAYGYILKSITLLFTLKSGTPVDPGSLLLRLYNNASGVPGSAISGGNFNVPTITSSGEYNFTLTNSLQLAANTTYWLVAGVDPQGNPGTYMWGHTSDGTETGLADWSIGNTAVYSVNQGIGVNPWTFLTGGGTFQFKVTGSANLN
ncbi:hypothetical protein PN437_20105 [Microcystis aeruginosa CS-564/01]|uniref:choice-of-anchor R domain-containing protein n=1 Tax=Microcystis aeruginosa TaxID=1126 RepID=UPI00232B9E00|nr:choice-of-anchor R domain-containing protein [Microcystis aeruginosa]MDB9427169.1 hypothetical protein [Microcystis aeruginosa CS-564/01]